MTILPYYLCSSSTKKYRSLQCNIYPYCLLLKWHILNYLQSKYNGKMDVRRVTFSSQENQGESGGENLQNVKKQKRKVWLFFAERKKKGRDNSWCTTWQYNAPWGWVIEAMEATSSLLLLQITLIIYSSSNTMRGTSERSVRFLCPLPDNRVGWQSWKKVSWTGPYPGNPVEVGRHIDIWNVGMWR